MYDGSVFVAFVLFFLVSVARFPMMGASSSFLYSHVGAFECGYTTSFKCIVYANVLGIKASSGHNSNTAQVHQVYIVCV